MAPLFQKPLQTLKFSINIHLPVLQKCLANKSIFQFNSTTRIVLHDTYSS